MKKIKYKILITAGLVVTISAGGMQQRLSE